MMKQSDFKNMEVGTPFFAVGTDIEVYRYIYLGTYGDNDISYMNRGNEIPINGLKINLSNLFKTEMQAYVEKLHRASILSNDAIMKIKEIMRGENENE